MVQLPNVRSSGGKLIPRSAAARILSVPCYHSATTYMIKAFTGKMADLELAKESTRWNH
jgi:hypothetical protein